MSFFIKGKQLNGTKRAKYSNEKNKKKKVSKSAPGAASARNDEITSSEDENFDNEEDVEYSSSEDIHETAQEKKLRLAKIYLKEIEEEERLRLENKEIDRDVIAGKLKTDYLKETGKLRLSVADNYKNADCENISFLKCRMQTNCITCMCLSSDDKYVYAGSKDGKVVKYSLIDNKKVGIIPFVKSNTDKFVGHSSKLNAIAISTDNKYLATADESGSVHVWEPETLVHVKSLNGHKNAVMSLTFKKDSHTLYSGSKDRTIKVWSLDEMAFVETLFGHQDMVTDMDALYRDQLVSSGGRDLRVWKVTEETQLIFNGHKGNIDNVKLINEEHFITSGDDGQICVWSTMRKKPMAFVNEAHGVNPMNSEPNWITALASYLNTDLVASGSHDGFIKVWKLDNNFKLFKLLFTIPLVGFINSIKFTSDGTKLLVAVGREYKLGRWITEKTAKNGIYVIPLLKNC